MMIKLTETRRHDFWRNAVAICLVTDVPGSQQLRLRSGDQITCSLSYLTCGRSGCRFLGKPDPALLGKPLDSAFTVASPNECARELDTRSVGNAGMELPAPRIVQLGPGPARCPLPPNDW